MRIVVRCSRCSLYPELSGCIGRRRRFGTSAASSAWRDGAHSSDAAAGRITASTSATRTAGHSTGNTAFAARYRASPSGDAANTTRHGAGAARRCADTARRQPARSLPSSTPRAARQHVAATACNARAARDPTA